MTAQQDLEALIELLRESRDEQRFVGFLESVRDQVERRPERVLTTCSSAAEVLKLVLPTVSQGTATMFLITVVHSPTPLNVPASLLYDLLIDQRVNDAVAETDRVIFGTN